MSWQLILREFGPNIQHIAVVDNIVSDTTSRFPCSYIDKYKSITKKDQCYANDLFAIIRTENNEDCFLLNLLMCK